MRPKDLRSFVGRNKIQTGVFVSEPDNVMIVHISAENGTVELSAYLDGRNGYYDDNRPVKKKYDNVFGRFGR